MEDLPIEYYKILSQQFSFISVFLGGISATILGTLIVTKNDKKVFNYLIIGLAIAAVSFIVSVIALNRFQLALVPDTLVQNPSSEYPKIVGALGFYVGIYALLVVISLSGWLINNKIGLITSIIGIIAGVFIFTLT